LSAPEENAGIVPPTLNTPELDIVNEPVAETLKELASSVPFMVRPKIVFVPGVSTVTVWFAAITTLLPAVGTTPPTHVEPIFQKPVCADVKV